LAVVSADTSFSFASVESWTEIYNCNFVKFNRNVLLVFLQSCERKPATVRCSNVSSTMILRKYLLETLTILNQSHVEACSADFYFSLSFQDQPIQILNAHKFITLKRTSMAQFFLLE
jgi:hypothetical protein